MIARATSALRRTGLRWASSESLLPPPSALKARVIRFADSSGQESFGAFSNEAHTHAQRIRAGEQGELQVEDEEVKVVAVLPPLEPAEIWCVGLNYEDHAKETGMELPRYPVAFLKAAGSCVGHEGHIILPPATKSGEVDFEGELAVVIGSACRNASVHSAMEYVMGYTIANDVTARRWQGRKGGGQWSRSKSFDTFCPLGPYLVPRELVPNPHDLRIRTWLNDTLMQDSSTSKMITKIPDLIAFLSQGTTLHPGTVILTGTPAGVGYTRKPPVGLKKGDKVTVEIDRLGTLTSFVAQEDERGAITF